MEREREIGEREINWSKGERETEGKRERELFRERERTRKIDREK